MQWVALRVPAGRVAAAEAVQQLVGLRERQVGGVDPEVEHDHVEIEEEVQVDVLDLEPHWLRAGMVTTRTAAMSRRRKTRIGESDPCRAGRARGPSPYREALDDGQEGHELVVVAFVEALRVAGVLVEPPRHGDASPRSRSRCQGRRWWPPSGAGTGIRRSGQSSIWRRWRTTGRRGAGACIGAAAAVSMRKCRHSRAAHMKPDQLTRNPMPSLPPFIAPVAFDDAAAALAQVRTIYDGSIAHLRGAAALRHRREPAAAGARVLPVRVRVRTDTVAAPTRA